MKKKDKFKLNEESRRYLFDTSKQIAAVSLIALGFIINLVVENDQLVSRRVAALSVFFFGLSVFFTIMCHFGIVSSAGKKRKGKVKKLTVNYLLVSLFWFLLGIATFVGFSAYNIAIYK